MSGQGTLIGSDRSKYVGEFKDDKFNGLGTLFDNEGSPIYIGECRALNIMDMELLLILMGLGILVNLKIINLMDKELVYSTGRKHSGEWKNSLKHGYGIDTSPDGLNYIGGWKENKFHGHGILISKTGERIYIGEFKHGDKHGQGIEINDGAKYVGGWRGK